jgi:hypothetical protein
MDIVESGVLQSIKLIIVTLFLSVSVYSYGNDTSNFHLFGTFASTILNTNNSAYNTRSGTSLDNQLILNTTYDITENVGFAAAIDITKGTRKDYEADIDYATLSYSTPICCDTVGTIGVGRVKYDIGLLENQRNNPHSRTTIYLPFSTYWPALNYYAQSVDGIQLDITKEIKGIGSVSFTSSYGNGVMKNQDQAPTFYGYFHDQLFEGDSFALTSPVLSNTIKFENLNWTIQYNQTELNGEYNQNYTIPGCDPLKHRSCNGNPYLPKNYSFFHKYSTLGIRYTDGDWTMMGEYVKHNFPTKPVGYFVRVEKQLSSDFTGFVGYSKFEHTNKNAPSPSAVAEWAREGREVVVGGVYHYDQNNELKVEYHQGYGTGWFPYPADKPNWNMFAVQYVHSFSIR